MQNLHIQLLTVSINDPEWDAIRAIRYQVFIEEQCVDEAEEYDEFEVSAQHVLALANGDPAGTARWRKTEKGYKLERFAVLKSLRGKGVGNAILSEVLSQVKMVVKDEPVYLHAQVQALHFYERAGFVRYGQEFDEAGIRHLAMKWLGNA